MNKSGKQNQPGRGIEARKQTPKFKDKALLAVLVLVLAVLVRVRVLVLVLAVQFQSFGIRRAVLLVIVS